MSFIKKYYPLVVYGTLIGTGIEINEIYNQLGWAICCVVIGGIGWLSFVIGGINNEL